MGKARFLVPAFMFIAGTLVALNLITLVTRGVPDTWLFGDTLSPALGTDIAYIMAIALPILVIEYVLLAVPIAVVILFITKIVKSTRYEMNIMNIGREFGGVQMVRRAAAPALFSVASAQLFSAFIRNSLFPPLYEPELAIEPLFNASLSLMGALLFVPIALALFMPTWVLNDAGVVTHLKAENLIYRQCPDTQGVGRWIANMLGGYALLAFPITMFFSQFYDPIILPIMNGTIEMTGAEIFYQVTIGLIWTIGLPFFVMAYIMPMVMFNEAMQTRSTVRILRLARRFGAKMVRKEQIQEIKRLSYAYDEDSKATVELYAAAANKEIVSTQKSIKKKQEAQAKVEAEAKAKARAKQRKKTASKKKDSKGKVVSSRKAVKKNDTKKKSKKK
ncbi:MAG: hypothetical protein RTU63_14090 [Candidatus Thorarchaeota archaeon]